MSIFFGQVIYWLSGAQVIYIFLHFNSDLDVTGMSEFSVNNSTYQVASDSVIMQNDSEKYQDSDTPLSDSDSDDDGDSDGDKKKTERYVFYR